MATAASSPSSAEDYGSALGAFLRTHSEESLYRASLLSQHFVESGLGPDEIIALHFETLDRALASITPREQVHAVTDAHQFLLEVMIAYGVKYREYLELRLRDSLREVEERVMRERERARALERIEQERVDLLATVAHELRTPITAVRASLDLALRSLDRGQLERLPRLLDGARDALDRLARLTSDLSLASHEGSAAMARTPQRVGAVVSQALTWAQAMATAKGVAVHLEDESADCQVLGNIDALLSVVGNLLSNAVRYTPAGGRVTVRCRREADWAIIEVEDTGIGMAPEVQARIFERFYRGPDAREREAQGLGLGLALVQQLVHAHEGQIKVTSTPGSGSTFQVVLPCLVDAMEGGDG